MELRDARAGEELAVAGVHVRSWQAAYRGLLPDAFLDALSARERAARYTFSSRDAGAPQTIVALLDEEIAAFATFGASRDADAARAAELYALYVDPPHWRAGAGRALLGETCERMRAHGYPEALLWVLVGNSAAERFYRAHGFRRDGSVRREDPWGVPAVVRRYRRRLA